MAPTMQPNTENDFLPPAGAGRPPHEVDGEDGLDFGRFSAIKKDQKEELERVDHYFSSTHTAIESQIRAENNQLFEQFQLGMQQFYTNLTKTINTTVENKVRFRLEQERLRTEHESKKAEVNNRYHNELSKLVISTSQGGRKPRPFTKLPSQTLASSQGPTSYQGPPLPIHSNGRFQALVPTRGPISSQRPVTPSTHGPTEFTVTDSSQQSSSAPCFLTKGSFSHRRQVQARSSAGDDQPGGRVVQLAPRYEHVAQLPTPLPEERIPLQRIPVPSEPCPAEHRSIEPRPVESRPTEHRRISSRSIEPRSEPRTAPISPEQRYVEKRLIQQRPVEQRPVEQRPVEQRSVEQRPVEQRPVEVPRVPQFVVESHQKQSLVYNTKRKAADSLTSVDAVSSSKRPRSGDSQTEFRHELSSPMRQSPRNTHYVAPAKQLTSPRTVPRTIFFREVYQDGRAQFKHKIFTWPKDSNDYYIVRCDEHGVHFNNGNPIHGAAKHVHSPQHGGLEKKHDLAMQICGHLVLDCTTELAELNNKEFERALAEDNYQVFNKNLLTKEGKRRRTDTPPAAKADTPAKADMPAQPHTPAPADTPPPADTPAQANTPANALVRDPQPPNNNMLAAKTKPKVLRNPNDQITYPKECEFHLGYWGKKWWLLIVLPIREDGSLREVGLREKLGETTLNDKVPKCYRTDRTSLQIKGLQPAYADGGPKANKREYPVMFFDSRVQRHSLSWLPASKLKHVDLFNPPDNIDERQVTTAREWYATRMMHRSSWQQFRELGPGEAPSPSCDSEMGKSDQWLLSLRSARTDDMSPIHDKSSGPGHFFASGSSDAGSSDDDDAEDFMKMDIGPIPEPRDASAQMPEKSDVNGVIRPGRRRSNCFGSRLSLAVVQQTKLDEYVSASRQGTSSFDADEASDLSPAGSSRAPKTDPPSGTGQRFETITVLPAKNQPRDTIQAKAVAAIIEATSRSRASSESPEISARPALQPGQHSQDSQTQARVTILSRAPFVEHSRSKSEDSLGRSEGRISPLTTTSSLNKADTADISMKAAVEATIVSHGNPYEKFEAIKAAMSQVQLGRPASAPVYESGKTLSPFSSPPVPVSTKDLPQTSPIDASQIACPPLSQSSTVVPARSLSSTPTNGVDLGQNTPKTVIPDAGGLGRWKVVRGNSGISLQEPRESCETLSGLSGQSGKSTGIPIATPLPPDAQLGTPIHDRQESFDVAQFDDSEGNIWSRVGPMMPFLRLVTDPKRKWAETTAGSPFQATIEPAQIQRVVTKHPVGCREKLRLHLVTKAGRTVMLMFETNSANGRSQGAGLQGRKFVSWVKANNEDVEWIDE